MPPETVTLVDFIANLSLDCNKAAYFVQEQVIGDPLDGVVIPEGAYPAMVRRVRVFVANNGPDSQLLQAGQKLEGNVVRETPQVPTAGARPATTPIARGPGNT